MEPFSVTITDKTRELIAYLICGVLSIIIVVWILQLWNVDLAVPFSYSGDTLSMSLFIKGLIDNPWWFTNEYLGMPFGQEHYDFPLSGTLDLVIIKIIGLLTHDFAITFNLVYLLTFPLAAIIAFYVFRKLQISISLSIFGSLLFTFAPYHFLRGLPHIFLSTYFLIPLAVLLVIWIYEEKPILFNSKSRSFELYNYYTIISIIICGLIALQSLYYCFFTCFLVLMIGCIKAARTKDPAFFIIVSLLVGFMLAITVVNAAPSILYQHEFGKNPDAINRNPSDVETYGLKIIQLILPIPNHRIPAFAELNLKYSSTAPLVNENAIAALGIIGTIGFIIMIIWMFLRVGNNSYQHLQKDRLDCLSMINLSTILLATIGGFSSLMAYTLFYDIRGYNRMSIFISFFAITTILLLIDDIQKRYCTTQKKKILFLIVLSALLLCGVLDQTSPASIPDYDSIKQEYYTHQQYIASIEEKMPQNAMIYQLPYTEYLGLGHGATDLLPYCSHAIPYLHSEHLRWSYGAMGGREEDLWQRNISELPIREQIATIANAGFNGILIDIRGYPDPDNHIIAELSDFLEIEPLISIDNHYYFFDLTG